MTRKTLVLGASFKEHRYSNIAIKKLLSNECEVEAIGLKEGQVNNVIVRTGKPSFDEIDPVTVYLNPERQKEYYEYIIALQPQRVIFNPGTENPEFEAVLSKEKINVEVACTLVLLATKQY